MALAISRAKDVKEAATISFYIYSIFNLTNVFMFKSWDVSLALKDTLWGVLLFSGVKYASLKLN